METLFQGVAVETNTFCNCYSGTKEALIAAGIAKPGWFPGELDCPRKNTYRTPDKLTAVYKRGRVRFEVVVHLPEEEHARRAGLERKRKALEKARSELECLPKSVNDYKERLGRYVAFALSSMAEYAKLNIGGYRSSAEILEAIKDAESELLVAIDAGCVAFSAKARAESERAIVAQADSEDGDFKAFLAGLVDGGNGASIE